MFKPFSISELMEVSDRCAIKATPDGKPDFSALLSYASDTLLLPLKKRVFPLGNVTFLIVCESFIISEIGRIGGERLEQASGKAFCQ